jgi:ABC-type transporter Mla MlaB component
LTVPRDLGEAAIVTHRPPGLAVDRAHFSGAPGVLLHGELDLDTAAQLTATLDAAIRETRGAFVIDLCDVTFLDSSGGERARTVSRGARARGTRAPHHLPARTGATDL